jgi:hypothetical protein
VNKFDEKSFVTLYVKDLPVLISLSDIDLVKNRCWHISAGGYVSSYDGYDKNTGNRFKIAMHNLILSHPDSLEIDHINGNRLDNRRENLRVVTHIQNKQNLTKKSKSKYGYYGVSFDKDIKKWRASIYPENKHITIGYFESPEEAALAYNKKAEELGFLTRNHVATGTAQLAFITAEEVDKEFPDLT